MHIGLIVDPYGEKSPGGLGRAIFEMARALIEALPEDSFDVYFKKSPECPPVIKGNWKSTELGGSSIFWSGARAMADDLDVYIFFNPIVPLWFFPKRAIVVVHDFAYLELPERSLKEKTRAVVLYVAHWLSLHKATAVVAVSEDAKQSTVRHFGIDPHKITVIYNGFIDNVTAAESTETPEEFFLFAGVLKERKNVLGVIRAFALFLKTNPGHKLLIAGKKEGPYFEKCQQEVEVLKIRPSVQFLGYVTDGQLKSLYQKAEALVFPSFIEGFGMPVLEAMKAGLPVITSNQGALAETAGGAAQLVDPYNPEDIAGGMQAVIDPSVRAQLIDKGRVRAGQFSWDKNAQAFKQLIKTIVK